MCLTVYVVNRLPFPPPFQWIIKINSKSPAVNGPKEYRVAY